jgi:tRNA(Arg) A34 adenosine deaminase TadA
MDKYMKIAIEEADNGIKLGHGGPFGTVIVKNGEIIARGHNLVLLNNDPTAHGEITALRAGGAELNSFDYSGCDLYTTGEPCPMCLSACMWANIENIYYGCSIVDNEIIGFRDNLFDKAMNINRDKLPVKLIQVDHKECLELFDRYNAIAEKTNY